MKKLFASALLLGALAMAAPASAHFMMMYTPEPFMMKAQDMDMRMVFTHPAVAGHMMNMGGVKDFYVVSKRGENEPTKTDLKGLLKEITWKNPDSSAPAYSALIPRKDLRSMGDYVFVLVPGYYHEDEEGVYMQQITKMIANVGGVPTIWNEPVGLPTEIVPMIKPYALWVGNVFQGQLLSEGKPVPNAYIEVEYLAHQPDLAANALSPKADLEYPNDALVAQAIYTDANGVFTFGVPKAGWWGFAALGTGPDKEYQGKELSQDAVIWIQATDIK